MTFDHVECEPLPILDRIDSPEGRKYITPSGLYYPSITTVLSKTSNKPELEAWKRKVGEEEAKRVSGIATRRGTRLHNYLEDFLNNKTIEIKSPSDKMQFESLKPELLANVNNIRHQECHLYSDYLQIAGQVDCIADYIGKLSVIDFKTSKERRHEQDILDYFIQSTFYALAYQELTGIKITQIVIMMMVDYDKPQVFVENINPYIKILIEKSKEIRRVI